MSQWYPCHSISRNLIVSRRDQRRETTKKICDHAEQNDLSISCFIHAVKTKHNKLIFAAASFVTAAKQNYQRKVTLSSRRLTFSPRGTVFVEPLMATRPRDASSTFMVALFSHWERGTGSQLRCSPWGGVLCVESVSMVPMTQPLFRVVHL